MKIVALNPPYFPMFSRASRSPAVTKSSTLYYPFFLAYATGFLEDAGFAVTLLDAPGAKLNRAATVAIVHALAPELVICETSTPSIENDMEVVKDLKAAGIPFVVAVGTHVSALPEEVLEQYPFLDAVARGEYEYTVRDLARSLNDHGLNADLSGIWGLSYVKNGKVCHNVNRPHIEDLDKLPFVSRVYRDHLRQHIDSYFYGANQHPVVAILSGRGCPHHCAYCVYPQTMTGHAYRLRSVGNLVKELEFICRELPEVREIFIEDDTLTVNRERAQVISKEITARGLKITWSTNSRADADYETMSLMHQAGCRLLCVGFESGSQEILDKLEKHICKDDYFRFRRDAARAGLLLHGCFMYGNDGETRETMEATLRLALELDCDTAQFYPIMIYPGTRAYQRYQRAGYITAKSYREWLTDEGFHNCVVSLPGISKEELVAFADYSRRRYYLRPRFIISKLLQMIRNPKESSRILRAGATLSHHLL
jgi:anaerobic magnesium-protoporphyrin IX monomethyl ester cyclase